MEFASYLAGERWSDHPKCTHPLLAALARHVNDCTSNTGRHRLVELVPSVIGRTSEDPHVDVRIALRAALTALPIVAADRVMAVAVLVGQQVLADLDGRPEGWLEEESRAALAQAPYAAEWARRYVRGSTVSPRTFVRHSAPSTVRDAVVGIARAAVPDPDDVLYGLLAGAIEDARAFESVPHVTRPEPPTGQPGRAPGVLPA